MDCKYFNACINNNKCFRCFNESLLKLPKEKTKSKRDFNTTTKDKRKSNSWEELENEMVSKLNNTQSYTKARRSKGSGNQWYDKGDVVDSILSIECKERSGSTLKCGDKSMSIKKSWLDKARTEAELNDRTMALSFKFKEDSFSYIIMRSDDIIDLVNELKELKFNCTK